MKQFKDFITEKENEYVLQVLADADINAKLEGKTVVVDSDDLEAAKKIVAKVDKGYTAKAGLNK